MRTYAGFENKNTMIDGIQATEKKLIKLTLEALQFISST